MLPLRAPAFAYHTRLAGPRLVSLGRPRLRASERASGSRSRSWTERTSLTGRPELSGVVWSEAKPSQRTPATSLPRVGFAAAAAGEIESVSLACLSIWPLLLRRRRRLPRLSQSRSHSFHSKGRPSLALSFFLSLGQSLKGNRAQVKELFSRCLQAATCVRSSLFLVLPLPLLPLLLLLQEWRLLAGQLARWKPPPAA